MKLLKWLIINLAALISIPYSYVNPGSYVRTNINGILNILGSCKRYKKELFILQLAKFMEIQKISYF